MSIVLETFIDKKKITLLENVLTETECKELIAMAESKNDFTTAKINVGDGLSVVNTDVRNSLRVIIECKELSNMLFEKIKEFIPKKWYRNNNFVEYSVFELNNRLKFLKYEPGQKFLLHRDANFSLDDSYCPDNVSLFTAQFYLNEDCIGGETIFYNEELDEELVIKPKTGNVLIFEQEDLVHEGAIVKKGVKYIIRCDVMFIRTNGYTVFPH